MDAGRYVVGVIGLGIVVLSVVVASRAIRRRFMPELDGPAALLAGIVVALSIVVVTSELLGTFGRFEFVPVVVVAACIGVVAEYVRRRAASESREEAAAAPSPHAGAAASETPSWSPYAAILAVAVAVASWGARTIDSLHHGITATVDTSWYHLPYAARFAQTGFTSRLHFPDAGSYTVFFPASSELLHAVGILLLGSDVLSPLVNLGWLALALFAAWCIGRPFGVGCIALVGVTILLTTPKFILDDGGSALNDVVGLALLLSAVALLVQAFPVNDDDGARAGIVACAGLAAGLALGTKYTLIAPVGFLTLGTIAVAIRRHRAFLSVYWTVAMLVTGGYWYLRNLVRVGNPVPSLALGLGPVRLNQVKTSGTLTIMHVIFDRHNWTAYLLPGLNSAFGRAWWALLALTFAGCALGLLRGPGLTVRMLAGVGIASFIAYLFSPEILGAPHAPTLFAVNVRYCAAALILGAVVLPIAARTCGVRWASAVLVAYVLTLVVTQISPTVWAHRVSGIAGRTEGWMPQVAGITLGLLVLVAGCAWYAYARGLPRRLRRAPIAIVGIAALVSGGFVLNRYYLDHRYQNVAGMTKIYRWARDVSDARIALVGTFLQYPLDGKDSSNYVQYLAERHPDGTSTPIARCADWRRALNRGKFDFVVVTTNQFPFPARVPTPQVAWTAQDPAASLVTQETLSYPRGKAQAWLYKIDGRMSPSACGPGD